MAGWLDGFSLPWIIFVPWAIYPFFLSTALPTPAARSLSSPVGAGSCCSSWTVELWQVECASDKRTGVAAMLEWMDGLDAKGVDGTAPEGHLRVCSQALASRYIDFGMDIGMRSEACPHRRVRGQWASWHALALVNCRSKGGCPRGRSQWHLHAFSPPRAVRCLLQSVKQSIAIWRFESMRLLPSLNKRLNLRHLVAPRCSLTPSRDLGIDCYTLLCSKECIE